MATIDIAALHQATANLEAYCAICMKVKDKSGDLVAFAWNRAQRHIHAALEKQRKEKGFVRALLLKGRQQGGSTYIGAPKQIGRASCRERVSSRV